MAEFRVISIITQTKNSHPIFLEFDSGTRLELMNKLDITVNRNDFLNQNVGINYLVFSVGSKEKVDELTSKFEKDGF